MHFYCCLHQVIHIAHGLAQSVWDVKVDYTQVSSMCSATAYFLGLCYGQPKKFADVEHIFIGRGPVLLYVPYIPDSLGVKSY